MLTSVSCNIRSDYFWAAIASAVVAVAWAFAYGPATTIGVTADEGGHIAAGLQWWTQHRFNYEPLTPPLGRLAAAFLPWLSGVQPQGQDGVWGEGRAILAASQDPGHVLFLARLSSLVFLSLASATVWLITRRGAGPGIATIAVGLFSTVPPILGAASIAATDLPQAAMLIAAIYALMLFIDNASVGRSICVGVTASLAIVAKFSTLVFYPASAAAILLVALFRKDDAWRPDRHLVKLVLLYTVPTSVFVIWALYNFRIGSLLYMSPMQPAGISVVEPIEGWKKIAAIPIFPANEFLRGLLDAFRRTAYVSRGRLFGLESGYLTYFFVITSFFIKTPVHFLLLTAIGIAFDIRQAPSRGQFWIRGAWVSGIAILLAATFTVPPLGVRYVLSVYACFSICAATAIQCLWRSQKRLLARLFVVGCAIWCSAIVVSSRRDYLGWFSVFAGPDPSKIEWSTDNDFGQFGVFLARELRARNVDHVRLMLGYSPQIPGLQSGLYHNTDNLKWLGMPSFSRLEAEDQSPGWIAISVPSINEPGFGWLRNEVPVVTIDHAISVYNIK